MKLILLSARGVGVCPASFESGLLGYKNNECFIVKAALKKGWDIGAFVCQKLVREILILSLNIR